MAVKDRIIVAGAGPVGMFAALKLGTAGFDVLVLEANDDLALDLRASTFHPPTLDMLDVYGVTQELIDDGLIAPKWQFRDRLTNKIAEFDLGILSDLTNNPYRLQCEQHKMTRIVKGHLDKLDNVEVKFGAKVVSGDQTEDDVTVVAEIDGENVSFDGAFVVAADGANSTLRISHGIGFEGITYPEMFIQASTPYEFRDDMPDLSPINYISDSDEWFVLLRVPKLWRALFPTREGEDEQYAISDEGIQKRMNGVIKRDVPYEIEHRTLYRVHQRVASDYRIGRICLAGDAAHLNNPLGGMGMNGGIHDAFNLCEKLEQIRDGADHSILDRYTRQRKPIAVEFVQAQAERNRQLLRERDPEVRMARFLELQETARDPEKAMPFLLRSSMIESLERSHAIE